MCLGGLNPSQYQAWDVMYLSTGAEDANGNPSAFNAVPSVATGLIVEPVASGQHPLFVIAEPEDADSTLKAPSYTDAQSPPWNLRWALGQGWDVLIPDHEGPASAYGAMPVSGHATLDGIRAAENLSATDGLDGNSTEVGLWGYSGGAGATVWASELAPTYAPELNIVGVAEGGVPHDSRAIFDAVNNGFVAPGLAFAIAVGLNSAYPNLAPMSILNSAGQALAANMRATGNSSYPQTYPPQNISQYTVCGCNPADHPDEFPGIAEVSQAVDSGQHVPKAPLFIYHDYNDELIPIAGVEQLVQYYCAGGATVEFRVNSGDEHVSNAVVGAPEALAYITARFKGLPAPDTCGLPDNGGVIPPSPVPAEPLPPPLPYYPAPPSGGSTPADGTTCQSAPGTAGSCTWQADVAGEYYGTSVGNWTLQATTTAPDGTTSQRVIASGAAGPLASQPGSLPPGSKYTLTLQGGGIAAIGSATGTGKA